jgi:hypothetical protein
MPEKVGNGPFKKQAKGLLFASRFRNAKKMSFGRITTLK